MKLIGALLQLSRNNSLGILIVTEHNRLRCYSWIFSVFNRLLYQMMIR